MKYIKYACNGYSIHVCSGDVSTLRLLDSSYNKLSTIVSNEGQVDAIINCSYFDVKGGYPLGRDQGDTRSWTSSWSEQAYLGVAVHKDGHYTAGKLEYWDGADDVYAGFTPATIIYLNGQVVNYVSTGLGYGNFNAKMNLATGVSLFGILSDRRTTVLITAQKGISGNAVVKFLVENVGMKFDLLCALDGGGSTEMIVNKEKVQLSTDGASGRSMYNGLAFISPKKAVDSVKSSLPFLERLSWAGMTTDYHVSSINPVTTGSKFWYNNNYNRFATPNLMLPNCTCYCAGRSAEIANMPLGTKVPGGNAKTWWTTTTWQKGSTPKIGAICVWGDANSTYGHVAIVEHVNDDGSVVISQSNYTRKSASAMNTNYFQNKTHKLVVGQAGSVGYPFLGYIYNPYINDIRVERNAHKSQVQVLVQKIKARKGPGVQAEWHEGLYIPTGTYDVLDTREADGFTWVQIHEEVWFATDDAQGWTATYLVNTPVVPNVPEETKSEVDTLKEELSALKNELMTLKENFVSSDEYIAKLEKQVKDANTNNEALHNRVVELEEKLNQIKKIVA